MSGTELPKRKPNRLRGWDYSQNGAYFVTICTKERKCILSTIVGGGIPLFQRSFHDHIIRNERDYQRIWDYIDTNPIKWEDDCFYTP